MKRSPQVVEFGQAEQHENYDSSVMKEAESNAEATGTKSLVRIFRLLFRGGNNASVEVSRRSGRAFARRY